MQTAVGIFQHVREYEYEYKSKERREVPPAGGAAIAAALSQNTGLFYSVLMLAGHRSTLTGNIATKWPVVEARVVFLNLDLSCLLNVLAAR